jgi:hypothetical protein
MDHIQEEHAERFPMSNGNLCKGSVVHSPFKKISIKKIVSALNLS